MARSKAKKNIVSPDPAVETPPKPSAASRGTWRTFDAATGVLAAMAAPRLAQLAWRAVTGKPAPKSTRSPDITMTEAVLWAALAGALAQVVRVVVARSTIAYWEKSTGAQPPGKKKN